VIKHQKSRVKYLIDPSAYTENRCTELKLQVGGSMKVILESFSNFERGEKIKGAPWGCALCFAFVYQRI
jgi:hypothetical protein